MTGKARPFSYPLDYHFKNSIILWINPLLQAGDFFYRGFLEYEGFQGFYNRKFQIISEGQHNPLSRSRHDT